MIIPICRQGKWDDVDVSYFLDHTLSKQWTWDLSLGISLSLSHTMKYLAGNNVEGQFKTTDLEKGTGKSSF